MMCHIHKARIMAIHHLTWSATASALEDEEIIAQALDWLTGEGNGVEIEREKSYHGAIMHRISCNITKKSPAVNSIPRMGEVVLNQILDSIEQRLDDENTLHIRLDLNELIKARITLGDPKDSPTVKCRIKLQVWPGEECIDVARKLLEDAIISAREQGLPIPPESLD